ncbi:MAG: putative 2-aminoethylphosphonate ABC transporter permease subunit [Clostridium sp.]|uniref:2-aminoethylphosphonate transport system permease protein PhnV n=1 Tax=Clostridium paraputrificum TaxID=29363 RepID=A0A6N3E6J5_9CLOT|nr:putative 2-aminoethylphosphonate ABC transporter permease subunit [Clostridium sp.]MBS5926204.1 putative 2-aminoethylphosphonate ABC transporter permease subunit [Clostridium sp.]MBS5987108.1 putative 2-aminoethylphosphonate ABC transporter permease subunit [Clostridium sp.]
MEFYKKIDLKKVIFVALVFILSMFLIVPLGYLFVQAFMNMDGEFVGLTNFYEYLKSPALVQSFKNTMFVSFTSTLIATVLALVYAYGLRRSNIRFKGFFKNIAMLPLFAPTMMHGIGLVYLFGNKGLITQGLGIEIPLYGSLGIVIAQVIYVFPQIFMILDVALSSTDYRLYEASRSMGVSKVREFFYITIPSIKYSLISSSFVAFTLAFTDFGAPKVVGGNYNVLSIDVYKQIIGQQNMPMGATVGIMLLIPAIISFLVTQKVQKKQSSSINAKSIPYEIKENKKRDRIFETFILIVALGIIGIMGTVLVASLVKIWPYDLSLTLDHYSMKNSLDGLKPFMNSIVMSLLTALIGTVFVFGFAYLTEKVKGMDKIKSFAHFLSTLPMALPGLVLGISYVLFFNTPEFNIDNKLYILNYFNPLYGTIFLMVFCNIVHFLSVTFITATTAIKKVDSELDMVAQSLGIKGASLLKNITLPLCLPSVLENFMYLFLNSMVTVSALIFLYTAKLKVAGISIVQLDDKGSTAEAAALAVLIVITNIIAKLMFEIIKNKLSRKYKGFE